MGEGYIDIIRLYVYVSDAKKIWQQIRGYANTHRAQLKSKPPSGSGADAKKPSKSWEYAGDVEFLLPHLGVTRKQISNLKGSELSEFSSTSHSTSSEAASLSGLHHDNDTECGTSSPALASVESTRRKRKAANSDEHINSVMLQYLRNQRQSPIHVPSSVCDPKLGWFQSIKPQLDKLDYISWLNFMTDSQRLLLSYMQNPPGPHYNSASALQLPHPTCQLPDPTCQLPDPTCQLLDPTCQLPTWAHSNWG